MLYRFENRKEAGRMLAERLRDFKDQEGLVVLALPRGGVPVAYEVATALNAPLDIFLVRKLGVPHREELAFGAIASGPKTIINKSIVDTFNIPDSMIEKVIHRELRELKRREKIYRRNLVPIDLQNRTVIVIDDGLATGATMRAALEAIENQRPASVIVAVPVASSEITRSFTRSDQPFVSILNPSPFFGVGNWYKDFRQVSDNEVCVLLDTAKDAFAGYMRTEAA